MVKTKKPRNPKAGDRALLPFGNKRVVAHVVEVRGPIGVRHRRLYVVRIGKKGEENSFEVPGDQLTLIKPRQRTRNSRIRG